MLTGISAFQKPIEINVPIIPNPLVTGHQLNAHKAFRRCPGRLLIVLCTFNLRHMSRGKLVIWFVMMRHWSDMVRRLSSDFALTINPANIYMFKINDKNNTKRCDICSKLTIKTSERRQWCRSEVVTVNFEHVSPLYLVFLSLTLNK